MTLSQPGSYSKTLSQNQDAQQLPLLVDLTPNSVMTKTMRPYTHSLWSFCPLFPISSLWATLPPVHVNIRAFPCQLCWPGCSTFTSSKSQFKLHFVQSFCIPCLLFTYARHKGGWLLRQHCAHFLDQCKVQAGIQETPTKWMNDTWAFLYFLSINQILEGFIFYLRGHGKAYS